MEKYLLQILESNNRVIIPEFGALIIKQKNPLTIIFNEFLQYNDGMLVDAISKSEGIDRDAAKKKIDEFTAAIVAGLEKNGSYSIAGIGIITKGTSGKISLEKEESKKAVKKETKPAEVPEKKPAQIKEKEKTIPKKTPEKKEETIEIEPEIPKQEKPKEEEKPLEKKELIADKEPPKVEKEPPKTERYEVHEKSEYKAPVAKDTKKTELRTEPTQPVYTSSPDYSTSKRGRTRLIIWLIVIVIINGGLIGYFLYSDEISAFFTKKQPVDYIQTEPMQEDQLQPETEPAEEPIEAESAEGVENEPMEAVEPLEATVKSGTRFYVVAGVFRDENNADNLVTELRQKGYNAEKFGKIGNLHAVSYNVFRTKVDAERELRKIQSEIDPEAWIREVK